VADESGETGVVREGFDDGGRGRARTDHTLLDADARVSGRADTFSPHHLSEATQPTGTAKRRDAEQHGRFR
jgi:hypothetical protein